MANFQDILARPSASVEPPKVLPVGTYLCLVDGQPAMAKIGKNQTDCVNFSLKPVQPQGDVDQQSLQEALVRKDGQVRALSDVKLNHRLFVTEDAVWRLKQFLDHLGIEEGSKTLGERIPEAMGKQVLITLGHRASDDGTQIFPDIKGTAKV